MTHESSNSEHRVGASAESRCDHIGDADLIAEVRFGDDGLCPVIAQSLSTGEILMFAWTDRTGLAETLATGRAVYFSRSRGQRWEKGATSGNRQKVLKVLLDCDGDAMVWKVEAAGPACHTGQPTCFFRCADPAATDLTWFTPRGATADVRR